MSQQLYIAELELEVEDLKAQLEIEKKNHQNVSFELMKANHEKRKYKEAYEMLVKEIVIVHQQRDNFTE